MQSSYLVIYEKTLTGKKGHSTRDSTSIASMTTTAAIIKTVNPIPAAFLVSSTKRFDSEHSKLSYPSVGWIKINSTDSETDSHQVYKFESRRTNLQILKLIPRFNLIQSVTSTM